MKPQKNASEQVAPRIRAVQPHTAFTLNERDELDRVKARAHALVTAALNLHDYGDDGPIHDDLEWHGNPIGHLLEMAREQLDTINELVKRADHRRLLYGRQTKGDA